MCGCVVVECDQRFECVVVVECVVVGGVVEVVLGVRVHVLWVVW